MTSKPRHHRLRLTEQFGFGGRRRSSRGAASKGDSNLSPYFQRFREITKATNRVALLWLAALIIVWYTGLERTRLDANSNFVSLEANNREKQKFEHQIWLDHQRFVEANFNARLFEQHKQENENRTKYERELDQAEKSGNKVEIKRLTNILKRIELRLTPLDKLKGEDRKEAEDAQRVEKQREPFVKVANDLKQNQENKAKQYAQNQLDILKRYRDLREQRKGVDFEILNQKFEVPPLFAAIIWSVFLIGLILYVARARFLLLSLSGDVLIHSQDREITERFLRAEAPWWLAPLPRLQFQTAGDNYGGGGSPVNADSSQLYRLLGWENGNRAATLLVMFSLLGLTLLQIRVVWLELEISRLIGTMQQRAVIPVIATAVLFLTFLTIWLWLRLRDLVVTGPEQTNRHTVRPTYVISALLILGIFAFLVVFLARRIDLGISYERGLKTSSSYLSVLLIFEVLAFCLYEWFRPLPGASAGIQGPPGKRFDRRWFLYAAGVFAIVGGIGIGSVFAKATRKQPRTRLRRPDGTRAYYTKRSIKKRLKNKKSKHKVVNLPAGFYLNPEKQIVHFVSKNRYLLGSRNSKINAERLEEFLPHSAARVLSEPESEAAAQRQPSNEAQGRLEVQSEGIFTKMIISRQDMPTRFNNSRENKPNLFSLYPFSEDGQVSVQDLVSKPRVDLSTASQAFDEAVLSKLALRPLAYQDYEKACELLAFAINHDILKNRNGQLPSFRLYDLLAGISVRYNLTHYLDKMLRLIESSNNADVFQSRMTKWQDKGSSWYRRWTNRHQSITWSKVELK